MPNPEEYTSEDNLGKDHSRANIVPESVRWTADVPEEHGRRVVTCGAEGGGSAKLPLVHNHILYIGE